MPDLIAFYQAHEREGLVLLAVNTSDDPGDAAHFARDFRLPFPVLLDADGRVMRLLHAPGLPGTFVVDRRGALRLAWSGPITPAALNGRVAPLIAE